MKSKKIEEGFLNFIINKFVSDLEAALIEAGFGETGLKKEVRKMILTTNTPGILNLKI